MKKYVNSLFLLLSLSFLVISCDSFVSDSSKTGTEKEVETEEVLDIYNLIIGNSSDSSDQAVVDFTDTTADGEYEEGSVVKASVNGGGMHFNGWYNSESGGDKISSNNPYNFYLNDNVAIYAKFTEGPTVPAINEDSYTPGDGWSISWQDEFTNGDFDINEFNNTDSWDREIKPQHSNNEWQEYTGAENTAVEEDGYLILKAEMIKDTHKWGSYTSARVISNPGGTDGTSESEGYSFKYGKIAARIQLPYGKGIWPAFWLLGDNITETGGDVKWPSCGEIDILETGFKSSGDDYFGHGTIGGTIHYDTSVDNTDGYSSWKYTGDHTSLDTGIYADQFRVYELEWTETTLTWRIDGVEYHSQDISSDEMTEFHENFYMIFNIAVGGDLTSTPDVTTYLPAKMYIDWVRHYVKG